MNSKKGSIKKEIFLKSLIIVFLAVIVMGTGTYGLIITNRSIETIIPLNRSMVQFVQVNNSFSKFENYLENYFSIRDDRHKILTLWEFNNTIKLLIDIENTDYFTAENIIDSCEELKPHLEKYLSKNILSSREDNEVVAIIYTGIKDIDNQLTVLLNNIPVNIQNEINYYKIKSIIIVISYGILALSIVVSYIIIGFLLSKKISRPITKLTEATSEIINGNITGLSVAVSEGNEIGELASSFNEMTSRLYSTLKELRESEEKYRTLFEREGSAIIIFETESGSILDINTAATKIYGYTWEELTCMIYSDLLETGSEYSAESRDGKYELHRKKDGTVFPAETSKYDITLWDKKASFIVSSDMTQKLRIEEMLIQSEKMMSIGGIAAGMAHEINNPLTVILSSAQLLSEQFADFEIPTDKDHDEKADILLKNSEIFTEKKETEKLLDNIISSGKKINEITESMLNFSRKENLKKSLNSIPFLVNETLKLISTNKYYKKVEIVKNVNEDVPEVLCDPNKIQQVLFNVLNNGMQAMEQDEIDSPKFIISIFSSNNKRFVVISIEDNGKGISEEIKKKIFEPFFTTKESGKGTGLGLSISFFIIKEYHGGEISVEPSSAGGADFIIKLPVN